MESPLIAWYPKSITVVCWEAYGRDIPLSEIVLETLLELSFYEEQISRILQTFVSIEYQKNIKASQFSLGTPH